MSEIKNIQIDSAKDIDVSTMMYNLIEYNDNYSETSRGLWQYYRDKPSLNDDGAINNVHGTSASFKTKQNITCETGADGTKDAEIMLSLRTLRNFGENLEMPLINH